MYKCFLGKQQARLFSKYLNSSLGCIFMWCSYDGDSKNKTIFFGNNVKACIQVWIQPGMFAE